MIFCQTERQKSKDKRLVSVVSIGFIENIKKMKRRLIILFCFTILTQDIVEKITYRGEYKMTRIE